MTLLLAIASVAVCLLVIKLVMGYASRYVRRHVQTRFREAEGILKDGRVPESWREPLAGDAAGPEGRERTKQAALDRLVGLKRFFSTCPYFAEGDARQLMLERLEAVERAWQRESADELLAPRKEAGPPA